MITVPSAGNGYVALPTPEDRHNGIHTSRVTGEAALEVMPIHVFSSQEEQAELGGITVD